MLLDTLCHYAIIFFARTIYTRWTKDDIRKVIQRCQILLTLQFALSISRIRLGCISSLNFLIRDLLAYGTEHTETTYVHETFQGHRKTSQGIDQILCSFRIHFKEILLMQTLRNTGSMNHIVKVLARQLILYIFFTRKIQLNKIDSFVCKIFEGTAFSYSYPDIHTLSQSFVYYKTANKTCGASYQYIHYSSQLLINTPGPHSSGF